MTDSLSLLTKCMMEDISECKVQIKSKHGRMFRLRQVLKEQGVLLVFVC